MCNPTFGCSFRHLAVRNREASTVDGRWVGEKGVAI